jgi:arabinogalactan endo-1,4-beta-galactosidase
MNRKSYVYVLLDEVGNNLLPDGRGGRFEPTLASLMAEGAQPVREVVVGKNVLVLLEMPSEGAAVDPMKELAKRIKAGENP